MEKFNSDLPTPPPTPSPLATPFSLSERINAATRPVHHQLNRLILARLPLALPPHAANPSTYISGILHIAPIYATFESLWSSIIDAPKPPANLARAFDTCDSAIPIANKTTPLTTGENISTLVHTPKVCSRTSFLLSHLRLPGLLRAGRLKADIGVLTGTPEHKINEQLESVSQHGKLADFIAHITRSVEANPHAILAYAWVLYMALFAGGRYLRAILSDAGGSAEFWTRDPSPVRPYPVTKEAPIRRRNSRSASTSPSSQRRSRPKTRSENAGSKMVPGLQFFEFIGEEDGEDIKREFKKRIAEVEMLLTEAEKEDIILEAQRIFEFMLEMVTELDSVMENNIEDAETSSTFQSSKVGPSDDALPLDEKRELKLQSENIGDTAHDRPRRPRYIERLFNGPIATVTSFKGGLQEPGLKPLGRAIHGTLKRRASIVLRDTPSAFKGIDTVFKGRAAPLSLLALAVVYVAWKCMT